MRSAKAKGEGVVASHVPYFRCMCLNVVVLVGGNLVRASKVERKGRGQRGWMEGGGPPKLPQLFSRFYPDPTG